MVFLTLAGWACMDLVTNEIPLEEISLGEVRIQLSVYENEGWSVWLTARDDDYRRIWRTPFNDEKGNMIVYATVDDAIKNAKDRLNNILSVSKKRFAH